MRKHHKPTWLPTQGISVKARSVNATDCSAWGLWYRGLFESILSTQNLFRQKKPAAVFRLLVCMLEQLETNTLELYHFTERLSFLKKYSRSENMENHTVWLHLTYLSYLILIWICWIWDLWWMTSLQSSRPGVPEHPRRSAREPWRSASWRPGQCGICHKPSPSHHHIPH